MDAPEAVAESAVPSVEQVNERATSMARLVDSFLRGRAGPSARTEAAAAVSDVRAFVRVWRPTGSGTSEATGGSQTHNDEGGIDSSSRSSSGAMLNKPSADVLLKLAQRGVQLHNNARKLPQVKDSNGSSGGGGGSGSVHHDWKSATVAYLRAAAASLVSLGSTSSPKDCANLCRLFSKAGELLVEDAGDDVRALEMFDDAQAFFRRLPGSFYGAGGQSSDMPSLSAEDLIMAMHKASSRRVEVLSRTTGNVDQMVDGYGLQLKILTKWSPAGLSVSTAVHAASVGEERFKKGDCRGASRLLRLALQALGGGDLDAAGTVAAATDAPTARTPGLRRTILFSLAHCCSKSGDHNQAIKCIKLLEGEGSHSTAGGAQEPSFLFAKCKVLADAGDLTGAYEAAEALVAAMPSHASPRIADSSAGAGCGVDSNLDLVAARMICSREDCSDRSLELFASIAARCAGSPKAIDARVALLGGLAMAARQRSEGCGAGQSFDDELGGPANAVLPREAQAHSGTIATGASADQVAAERAERAEKAADVVVDETAKCKNLARTQVEAVMEVLVSFAEFFHGRDRWQACARWCERAITVAKTLPNQPAAASSALPRVEMAGPSGSRKGAEGEAAAMLLASLLTLRGEMECRMGDFVSSGHTLDQALAECPTYGRAREVAFWSAALDPNRDESSLSARLSALSGLRSGLTPDTRRQYLAKCVGLVAGARKPGGRHRGTDDHPDWVPPGEDGAATPTTTTGTPDGAKHDGLDSCVTMVQERLLEALLLAPAATAKATVPTEEHVPSSSLPRLPTAEEDSGRSAPVSMDVEGEEGEPSGMTTVAEGGITVGLDPTTGKSDVPTAVQVVASMVDSALQCTSEAGVVASGGAKTDGSSSILSRVLLSIDRALSSAPSLGIVPLDDPDIEYLSQGCWNIAVRCCGSTCDLPWAESMGSSARNDRFDHMADVIPESEQAELLVLAPAFFKASRNWTEMRSDANAPDALLTRQHCMILGIAATLELYDLKQADDGAALGSKVAGSSERHGLLERARKEVEVANGLNRQLSNVKPDMATEMRSILLVAEMSVLGRLGDAVAVRSLVSSRAADLLRCSTNLLRYCVQLAEDMLDDAKAIAGLCRLCIQRCLEDDPIDTLALGGLYRQLLVSASSREEALLVVDQFTTKARDLREGPVMPSDDVDYFSAKCYNLGLQQMEMGRPDEAERFVGKALGLVKLGSSPAFAGRWEETIYQVYLTTLQAKGRGGEPSSSSLIDNPGDRSPALSTGEAFGAGRAFLSTGLFPMPPGTAGKP